MSRQDGLDEFYEILTDLRARLRGYRRLAECTGKIEWPRRGVYFFFEVGEMRQDRLSERVVRVGTHAVSGRSSRTLWDRLRDHRGTLRGAYGGGGSHQASIFRDLVGEAFLHKSSFPREVASSWSGSSASAAIRRLEHILEVEISNYIRTMPFLWLAVDDDPGPGSLRKTIERHSIALLSNFERDAIDPPSPGWLGTLSSTKRVRESGLWNSDHVNEIWDPLFLQLLRRQVTAIS